MDKNASLRFGVLLVALLAVVVSTVSPVWASGLQDGVGFNNFNFASVTHTYSFSGSFAGEGEIWLIAEELEVPAGARRQAEPPEGFTVTDFVVISSVLRGVDYGGYAVDDPPGDAGPPAVDLLCATEPARLYGYAQIGDESFGPVTAVVPIVRDGFEPNGLPKLYQAKVDPVTGVPVLNTGPGHCFIPTAVRINDPQTGEILPQFAFAGRPEACGSLEFDSDGGLERPRRKWWVWLVIVLVVLALLWFVRRGGSPARWDR